LQVSLLSLDFRDVHARLRNYVILIRIVVIAFGAE